MGRRAEDNWVLSFRKVKPGAVVNAVLTREMEMQAVFPHFLYLWMFWSFLVISDHNRSAVTAAHHHSYTMDIRQLALLMQGWQEDYTAGLDALQCLQPSTGMTSAREARRAMPNDRSKQLAGLLGQVSGLQSKGTPKCMTYRGSQ